eukprot:1378246-Amphidinium_carterae.1
MARRRDCTETFRRRILGLLQHLPQCTTLVPPVNLVRNSSDDTQNILLACPASPGWTDTCT